MIVIKKKLQHRQSLSLVSDVDDVVLLLDAVVDLEEAFDGLVDEAGLCGALEVCEGEAVAAEGDGVLEAGDDVGEVLDRREADDDVKVREGRRARLGAARRVVVGAEAQVPRVREHVLRLRDDGARHAAAPRLLDELRAGVDADHLAALALARVPHVQHEARATAHAQHRVRRRDRQVLADHAHLRVLLLPVQPAVPARNRVVVLPARHRCHRIAFSTSKHINPCFFLFLFPFSQSVNQSVSQSHTQKKKEGKEKEKKNIKSFLIEKEVLGCVEGDGI